MIKEKYGREGKGTTKIVEGLYGVSLWKSIMNLWPKLMNNVSFKVGNDMKTSFWEDKWLGRGILKQLFPDLHILSQQQHATIGEVWSNQGWNLIFRRCLNGWEIDRLTEFFNTLELFTGITTSEDSIKWQGNKQGEFSIRSAYKEFNLFNNQIGCWPWKMIWKVKIPYKVSCFTWLLARGKALTQDNLCKRGHHLCSKCFLWGRKLRQLIIYFCTVN